MLSRQIQTIIDMARAGDQGSSARLLEQALSRASDEGAEKALELLKKIKEVYNLPVHVAPEWSYVNDGIDFGGKEFPGISLVTCCMNRNENLGRALASWVEIPEISEIVIVDWSSNSPVAEYLASLGVSDPRIRVFRVNGQSRWILSYAFNLGFRVSRFDKIIKVDADIVLDREFFAKNPLRSGAFISGDWRVAEKGQEYINGFFYVRRKDLFLVKGFNEYITTYGWDDDDIYNRLEEAGCDRDRVDPKTIYHLPHDDAQRTGEAPLSLRTAAEELRASTDFKIRANRFTAMVMPYWNKDRLFLPFKAVTEQADYVEIVQAGEAAHKVPTHIREDAEYYASLELVSWRFGHGVFELSRQQLNELLDSHSLGSLTRDVINAATYRSRSASTGSRKRKLYIDVQHGLGNRLRAFASAAAVAEKTGRELVLIWVPDHHCDCRFSDLFEYDGEVVEELFTPDAENTAVYNYMEIEPGAVKDQLIELDEGKDIYVRSAYVLNHLLSDWDSENDQLRKLVPSARVRELIDSIDVQGRVGVHVRMEAGKGLDNNSWDASTNWSQESHQQIHYWREKSHYSHFIRRIDGLIAENSSLKLFLATDLKETYSVFEQCYGDRLSYLKRDVYDRSKEQIVYALADAILLSRCERLLGSTWSSFSEIAMRFSITFKTIEMSGKDF